MASTTDLKTKILGYLSRKSADLTIDSKDLVLTAINNAIDSAQRIIDFNFALDTVTITNSSIVSSKVLLSAAKDGSNNSVKIKRVQNVNLLNADGSYTPLRLFHKETLQNDKELVFRKNALLENFIPTCVLFGTSLELLPNPQQAFTLVLDAFVWQPALALGSDKTNFILDYCEDYVFYKALLDLSLLLRVETRQKELLNLLTDARGAMENWNNSYSTMTNSEAILD